jgi:uncharacterized membrane protein
MVKTALGFEENLEAVLCYLGFWVTGLIFYFVEDKNKFIRFLAMQSILVFLPLTILASIPVFVFAWLSGLFWALILVLWIILMLKAYQMLKFKLPIVGDIAEKNS